MYNVYVYNVYVHNVQCMYNVYVHNVQCMYNVYVQWKGSKFRATYYIIRCILILKILYLEYICCNSSEFVIVREHPFNLKGVGRGYGFFSSRIIFFRFVGGKTFRDNLTLFFFYKNNFLRHKVLSEYICFLAMSETDKRNVHQICWP